MQRNASAFVNKSRTRQCLLILTPTIALFCLELTSKASLAAIIRRSSLLVLGSALGGTTGNPNVDNYNKNTATLPNDFSTFDVSITDSAELGAITSSSRAQQNSTLSLDGAGNLISAQGSASVHAEARVPGSIPQGQRAESIGTGQSIFNVQFDIPRAGFQYAVTAAGTGASLNTFRSSAGSGRVSLNSSASGLLFRSEFRSDMTTSSSGSPRGPLPPGSYQFDATTGATAAVLAPVDSAAQLDVTLNWQLTLIPPILWSNASSGVFQTGGNWSSGAPPSGVDNAVIDRAGTYTVSLAGNAAHSLLNVSGNGANVTLDLDGFRYQLDELHLGDPSGNFSFTLSDSSGIAAVPPRDDGPWPAPGAGEAEISIVKTVGPGRTDITAETISQSGLVDHGHIVNVLADGDWRMDQLTVGDQSAATVLISGGNVNSRSSIVGKQVRGFLSNPGKVVVRGAGVLTSKFDGIEMIVGDGGKGELEITAGGEVSAAQIRVGNTANGQGEVTVDGATARLHQNHAFGHVEIGSNGKGTLNVLNDASVVAAGNFSIGVHSFSDGIVNVTSNGLIRAKRLVVGNEGKGTLSLLDDGVAEADQMRIGPEGNVSVGDEGVLVVANVLTVNGELSVNTTGAARVGPGLGATVGKLILTPGGTLRGNGTIRADLGLAGGASQFTGSRLAPANSTGTLTIEGDVEQAAGSAMEIEIGGTGAGAFDVLKVTGDATLGGDVFLKFTDGFAPQQGQQFEFLDVSGTLSGSFANVHLRNLAPGFQFDLSRTGGGMTMVALNDGVFSLPQSSAWNVDASGNWASVANWTDGDPNHAGVTAVMGSKITAPRTVTADEPFTVGRIDFDNTHAYTIDGENTLTLDSTGGDAQINVASGSHTISAPVSLADNTVITVSPAASNLTVSGAVNASALNLTKVGAGRLTLVNLQAAGLTIDQGTLTMAPSGTDASTSVINSLSIAGGAAPTAKLDLTDNAAVIDYSGTSPAATVRAQILAGRGGPGLGATWNGQGVNSSAAATVNAADPESRSVGYAENAAMPLGGLTTFRGHPVDDTSILIAFTRTGDANLDGLVNDDDVTIVGATFAPGVPQPSWALGDFDYNGFVDDDDVTLLGVFYDPSATPLFNLPAEPGVGASASGVAAVPEPATALLLATGVTGILLGALNRKRKVVASCYLVKLLQSGGA
jgi:T5SS/PEP-CTERM-associated repeat protein